MGYYLLILAFPCILTFFLLFFLSTINIKIVSKTKRPNDNMRECLLHSAVFLPHVQHPWDVEVRFVQFSSPIHHVDHRPSD